MKRGGPLQRRTPLQGANLKRGAPTVAKPRTRIAPRSDRRQADMMQRRALVVSLLAEWPTCQLQVRCRGARSVDVHERLKRSRGGNILDPVQAHMVTTCRACHEWTEDPDRTEPDPTERRALLPSWHVCPPVGPC